MASRLFRPVLIIVAILGFALPVKEVQAAGSPLPSLTAFARSLINGDADQLVGVYVPELFARDVVQQPIGDPAYVSDSADVITQFARASEFGSTGLLAHNYLAGYDFASLVKGQAVYLVFGDGRTLPYVIQEIGRYQALQPNSTYSAFKDLANGKQVGASDLFLRIYDRPGALILQTCIAADGISTWGRLFVVALPAPRASAPRNPCSACQ